MITIYFGKSASGKDYFLKKLIRHKIQPIISYTTRPIRDNETNGIDYNFVTNKEFKDLIKIYKESYKEIFLTPFNILPKPKHIETVFIT